MLRIQNKTKNKKQETPDTHQSNVHLNQSKKLLKMDAILNVWLIRKQNDSTGSTAERSWNYDSDKLFVFHYNFSKYQICQINFTKLPDMHLRAGSNNRKTLLSHAYKSPFTVHLQHLLHNQRQHMHNFLISDFHLCGLKQQQRNSQRVYLNCNYCTRISLTFCCFSCLFFFFSLFSFSLFWLF